MLEVKSVTLARGSKGFFPDAVTKRGAKHVRELTALNLLPEYESAVLFVSQHSNISTVEMESSIDADFAKAIKEANDKGVFISAVSTELSKQNICLKIGFRLSSDFSVIVKKCYDKESEQTDWGVVDGSFFFK